MYYEQSNLPFSRMLQSSGGGEPWTNLSDENKFREFGWRTTTNESSFKTGGPPLMGNWREERFDIEKLREMKPLPSQYDHYFLTTSKAASEYHKPEAGIPESIKYLVDREPRAYSCHQPEIDPPQLKEECNSWETTYRVSYALPAFPSWMMPTAPQPIFDKLTPQVQALEDMERKRKEIGPPAMIKIEDPADLINSK